MKKYVRTRYVCLLQFSGVKRGISLRLHFHIFYLGSEIFSRTGLKSEDSTNVSNLFHSGIAKYNQPAM